jgi:carboxymethylenebutenolidase
MAKRKSSPTTDPIRRGVLVAGTAVAGAALIGAKISLGSTGGAEPGMAKDEASGADPSTFSPAEQALIDVWNRHTAAEFAEKDADAAIATMTDHPVLIHVPVGTGATGREALRKFYREIFIPQMPSDAELQLLNRSVGRSRVIDEFILRLTHTVRMDWFAPGIEATGRRLEVPHVAIIAFEDGKIASEHIYWDQATVLVQLGVLDAKHLPALGAGQSERLLRPEAPANQLIERSK